MSSIKGVKGFVSKEKAKELLESGQAISGTSVGKDLVSVELNNLPSGFSTDFVGNLRASSRRKKIVNDFRRPYFPSDNIYQSNQAMSTSDRNFRLQDLDTWMHNSVGVGARATYGISEDSVKNGFEFISDPDKEDAKAVKKPNITKWMRQSNFLDMLRYWEAFDLGMGFGLSVGYWKASDINAMSEAPPKGPPKRFEVLNPRWLQPTGNTLTKSKRLNYDEEQWEFTGGGLNQKINIHRDRVFVLRTTELTGQWQGMNMFDPVRYSLLGYFNNLIYIARGIQNWGDVVAVLFYGQKFPTVTEQNKIMEVLDYYEMNGRMHLPEGARLEMKPTQVGKGIGDAMEQYKEDLCAYWVVPKNQLFGRSQGGGLTAGPAVISKDDYYEMIGSRQIKLSHPVMDNFIWRFFPDTDNLWPRWHLNVYKSDEQRLKERILSAEAQIKEMEVKKAKFEMKYAKENMKAIKKEGNEVPNLITPGNGGVKPTNGGSDKTGQLINITQKPEANQ